jgi:hypothetical protein
MTVAGGAPKTVRHSAAGRLLRSFPADDYVLIRRVEEDDVVLILHVL